MAEFNLPFGVYVAASQPADLKYPAATQVAREAYVTNNLSYRGMLVYQEDTDELWVLKGTTNSDWVLVGQGSFTGGDGIDITNGEISLNASFLDLTDTPATYGSVGQAVRIAAGGASLEFYTPTDANDFISNVTYSNGDLIFTGSGSAFNGTVDISALLDDTNSYISDVTLTGTSLIFTNTGAGAFNGTIDLAGIYTFDITDGLDTSTISNGDTISYNVGITADDVLAYSIGTDEVRIIAVDAGADKFVKWDDTAGKLVYGDEEDPIFTASAASGILAGDITNWDNAYNNMITAIDVTGTSTKTITLTQQDGGTLTANFTDASGSTGVYDTALTATLAMPNSVGGWDAGTLVSDVDGNTFIEMWDTLLFPEVDPYIETPKSVTLTEDESSPVEVGTTLTPNLLATFDRGQIYNGDGTVGPDLVGLPSSYEFEGEGIVGTDTVTTTALTATPTSAVSVEASQGNNSWSVTVNHDAGTGTYTTNFGNTSTVLDPDRAAGTATDSTQNIVGVYKAFYGLTTLTPTSAEIRALTHYLLDVNNDGTFDINVTAGSEDIAFAVPANQGVTVLLVESSNANITASFSVQEDFSVDDAGTGSALYDIYTTSLAGGGYPSDVTYRVIVS